MSLQTRLEALVAAIGADIKTALARPVFRVITMHSNPAGTAWTSMPAALTEYGGTNRTRVKADLTGFTQARLTVAVSTVGNSTAEVRIQYATDGDTQAAWAYLDGVDGPKANITTAANGRVSAWVNLAAGAKGDVWLRVVGINGNGTLSPVLGTITLQVK